MLEKGGRVFIGYEKDLKKKEVKGGNGGGGWGGCGSGWV